MAWVVLPGGLRESGETATGFKLPAFGGARVPVNGRMVTGPLALAFVLVWLAGPALATHWPDEDLGALEEAILAREPLTAPMGRTPTGGAIPVEFSRGESTSRDVRLDEATVLNGIALARRSGTTLTVADLRASTYAEARDTVSDQLPPPGPLLDALTVGVFAPFVYDAIFDAIVPFSTWNLDGLPLPLHLILLMDISFALRRTDAREVSLDDETTEAALALMAGGVEVDPRALLSERRDSAYLLDHEQDAVFSLPFAAAVEALGLRAVGELPLDHLENATLRRHAVATTDREVRIDPEHALEALALHRRGLPVEVTDLTQTSVETTSDLVRSAEHEFSPNNVFSRLILRPEG